MLKRLLIIFFLGTFFNCFGIDIECKWDENSIDLSGPIHKNDSALIVCLIQQANDLIDSNKTKSKLLINEAVQIFDQSEHQESSVSPYLTAGKIYLRQNQLEKAIEVSDKSFRYFSAKYKETPNIDLQVKRSASLRLKAVAYRMMGNYDGSQEINYKCLDFVQELYERYPENELLAKEISAVYISLAQTLHLVEDIELYYTYSQKARAIVEPKQDTLGLIDCYRNLGNYFSIKPDYDSALYFYRQCIDLSKRSGTFYSIAKVYYNKAALCQKMNANDQVEKYLLKSLEWANKVHSMEDISRANLQLGKFYLESGNIQLALRHNQEAELLIDTLPIPNQLANVYQERAEIYERLGDYEEALWAYERFKFISDSLQTYNNRMQIKEMEQAYALNVKIKENELLKKEEAQKNQLLKQKTAFNLLLLVAIVLLIGSSLLAHKSYLKHKNISAELKIKNDQLNEVNKEKDGLISIVAHDLKSPLLKIKGLTSLFAYSNQEEVSQLISMIQSEIKNGELLISDLSELINSEYQKDHSDYELVKLDDFVGTWAKRFEPVCQKKDIKLRIQTDSHQNVVSSTQFLSRVLDNLSSNAAKFSNPGTAITIRTYSEGNQACISIKDEGPGFTEEDQKSMFNKFSKLSANPTNGESSTGLGLAIVKLLCGKLKVDISYVTAVGEGTKFILKFKPNSSFQVNSELSKNPELA